MSLAVFYDKEFLLKEVNATKEEIMPNALILGYPAITLSEWNQEPMSPEIERMMDEGLMPDLRGANIPQILSGKMNVTPEEAEYFNLLNHVSETTPPVFMWGSNQDTLIHPSDLWGLAEKLRENKVPYEMHIFGRGPHGQGISDEVVLNRAMLSNIHLKEWVPLSLMWLEENRNERV